VVSPDVLPAENKMLDMWVIMGQMSFLVGLLYITSGIIDGYHKREAEAEGGKV
tara:strand:- start:938 stop:1096 length:159 start_codon:yes stop_codon:yes gene_type:complete